MKQPTARPTIVDRTTFQDEIDRLRTREKAHTREQDAIAAQRRRLPMVEVDGMLPLTGPNGAVTLLDAFEGRSQLIAYFSMWHQGRPAAEQCEGCTWVCAQIGSLDYLHSRDITFAVLCQGPYAESRRYRDFMGWRMPWYSALDARAELFAGRELGRFHLICYLRDGDKVYETYWTEWRGCEALDNSYRMMDLTPYGRRETWEDSPQGWPQDASTFRSRSGPPEWAPIASGSIGRPISQWSRIAAGHSDDLGAAEQGAADGPATAHCCR
jgi:predicted dithiol-disulfide oxidoreductase (DUF899 family)